MMGNIIAKIEGHGALNIDFDKKKIRLSILEGERLFEGLLVGRSFEQSYWITPRICGVCPVVHCLASVKAVEDAFNIRISSTSKLLRSLLVAAQMLQSHILHLVFLSLPDYLGVDRGTEIRKKHPKYFDSALKIKNTADKIVKIIGGRAVHPVTVTAGGFFKYPGIEDIKEIKKDLLDILEDTESVANLCLSLAYPEIKNDCEYLSSAPKNLNEYPIYEFEDIETSRGFSFRPNNYDKEIKEKVVNYSTAKFSSRFGKGFMVGSLARLILFGDRLSPYAKNYIDKVGLKAIKFNPFYNNLAQAIEMVEYAEKGVNLCDRIIKNGLDERASVGFKVKAGRGVGVMEAPRGTLYHDFTFDKNGVMTKVNIITPTAQNLTHIEEDANALLKQIGIKNHAECRDKIEMLIRAYDPCITCSVH